MYAHPNFHLFFFFHLSRMRPSSFSSCTNFVCSIYFIISFGIFYLDLLFYFFFSIGFDRLDRNRDPYRRDTQLIVWSEGRDIPLTAAKAVDYLCITNETSHVVRQDSGEKNCHPRKWQAKIHLNQFLISKSFFGGKFKNRRKPVFLSFRIGMSFQTS